MKVLQSRFKSPLMMYELLNGLLDEAEYTKLKTPSTRLTGRSLEDVSCTDAAGAETISRTKHRKSTILRQAAGGFSCQARC